MAPALNLLSALATNSNKSSSSSVKQVEIQPEIVPGLGEKVESEPELLSFAQMFPQEEAQLAYLKVLLGEHALYRDASFHGWGHGYRGGCREYEMAILFAGTYFVAGEECDYRINLWRMQSHISKTKKEYKQYVKGHRQHISSSAK